jgi:hypothetical protein
MRHDGCYRESRQDYLGERGLLILCYLCYISYMLYATYLCYACYICYVCYAMQAQSRTHGCSAVILSSSSSLLMGPLVSSHPCGHGVHMQDAVLGCLERRRRLLSKSPMDHYQSLRWTMELRTAPQIPHSIGRLCNGLLLLINPRCSLMLPLLYGNGMY